MRTGESHYRKKILHSRASLALSKTDKVLALSVAKDFESLLEGPAEAHMSQKMISVKKGLNNGRMVPPIHTWKPHEFEDMFARAKFNKNPSNGTNSDNKNRNNRNNRNKNNKNGKGQQQNNQNQAAKPQCESISAKDNTKIATESNKKVVRFVDDMRDELQRNLQLI